MKDFQKFQQKPTKWIRLVEREPNPLGPEGDGSEVFWMAYRISFPRKPSLEKGPARNFPHAAQYRRKRELDPGPHKRNGFEAFHNSRQSISKGQPTINNLKPLKVAFLNSWILSAVHLWDQNGLRSRPQKLQRPKKSVAPELGPASVGSMKFTENKDWSHLCFRMS